MPAIHDHADSAEEEPLVFKPVAPFSPALTKHGFVELMTLLLEKRPGIPITEEMLGPMYDIMCSKEAHKLINACADCCGADSQISQVVCAQMAVKAKERGYFFGYLVPMAALVVIGATELGHVYGALNSENDGYKWIPNTLTIINGLCLTTLAIYVGRSARDGMLFAAKHAIHQPEETPEDQSKKAFAKFRAKLRAQRAGAGAAAPDHDVERGVHDR